MLEGAMRPEPDIPAPSAAESPAVDDAVRTIRRELSDIHESMPRCSSCENYLAVVARVRSDLDGVATADAADAREQLAAWLAESVGRIKTTNHCEVCVPAGPYERFSAALSTARGEPRSSE
jgi:hypothetical protein